MAVAVAVSIATFATLDRFLEDLGAHDHLALRRGRVQPSSTGSRARSLPEPLTCADPRGARSRWPRRGSCARSGWRSRSWSRRAGRSRRRPGRSRASGSGRSRAAPRNAPEVTFVPGNTRVAPKPGQTLLEVAEGAGMTIEAGCRMGVCGADPVAIRSGLECTSRGHRRRAGDAQPARLRPQHPDGVLRARVRPGGGRADAGQGRRRPALSRIEITYDRSIANASS